jgi:nucleoside-diphosphate-sugar epimerase
MSGVAILGGSGFLGGHLVPSILETGRKVKVIDVVPPDGAFRLKPYMDKIQYSWKSAIDVKPEDFKDITDVIYLGSQADVPLAINSPLFTTNINVNSIVNYLETVSRMPNGPRTIYMSSESSYGLIPIERQPITEEEVLNPVNVYGASKAAAEIFVGAYARQFNLPSIIIRSTTMYGGASRSKQVVPIFINQALKGKPITIEGDGSASRDFNYVKNSVHGIMKILNEPKAKGIYNIGSGVELSVKELAEHIIRISGSTSEISYGPWRAGEQGVRLNISIEKARREVGYEPLYTVEQGLTETIDWWRKNG